MQVAVLYGVTLIVFLILDAIMLSRVMQPLFASHLGDALLESPRILPAALFYGFYLVGVLWFASLPALRAEVPVQALLAGAFLGALAYGTYEFTNYATLKDWHWQMVATDVTWGAVLTGVSAWSGVMVARLLG